MQDNQPNEKQKVKVSENRIFTFLNKVKGAYPYIKGTAVNSFGTAKTGLSKLIHNPIVAAVVGAYFTYMFSRSSLTKERDNAMEINDILRTENTKLSTINAELNKETKNLIDKIDEKNSSYSKLLEKHQHDIINCNNEKNKILIKFYKKISECEKEGNEINQDYRSCVSDLASIRTLHNNSLLFKPYISDIGANHLNSHIRMNEKIKKKDENKEYSSNTDRPVI